MIHGSIDGSKNFCRFINYAMFIKFIFWSNLFYSKKNSISKSKAVDSFEENFKNTSLNEFKTTYFHEW